MKLIRKRITYANVMSTIAVFMVLGGTAFAALSKNSVGAKQLKKNAVTSVKVKNNAITSSKLAAGSVTTGKLADGSVNSAKVADSSLTGTDIQQSTLTSVKASNVYGVQFQEVGTGSPKIATATDPGITSGGCFIVCGVNFPRDVSNCVYTVSGTSIPPGGSGSGTEGEAWSAGGKTVDVAMYPDGNPGLVTSKNFAMTVVCPT